MQKKELTALRIIVALSFAAAGLYYELAAALAAAALFIWLLLRRKNKPLYYRGNMALIAPFAIYIGYAVCTIWAVDSGLAAWGMAKYLPLPLMALCLMQTEPADREAIISDIPRVGCGMTVISFVLQYVPVFHDIFSVSGRLAGFFQYPNTFACFMLLGIEILIWQTQKADAKHMICGAILLFGLLEAGSRTVFVLAIAALVACLLVRRTKCAAVLAGSSVLGGGAMVLLAGLLGSFEAAQHMLSLTPGASTLLGRLLYWKDALPVILRHPFGLGYLGYYITQGSFQTGVYSVRWIHNDMLQILLDIGWLPMILAVVAVVRTLLSKRVCAMMKVLLLTLLAHSMMDFDLEFVGMYFIVLLCLDWDEGKRRQLKANWLAGGLAVLLIIGAVYLGIGSTMNYRGKCAEAVKWYPWDTLSRTELLTQAGTAEELDAGAERILAQNRYIALAWDAKAQAAYSHGDFTTVITAKRNAMALNKYAIDEYIDYYEKLAVGYDLYLKAGQADSAAVCMQELVGIQTRIDAVLEQTDELAWRIADKPELTMPQEYYVYVSQNSR